MPCGIMAQNRARKPTEFCSDARETGSEAGDETMRFADCLHDRLRLVKLLQFVKATAHTETLD